MRTRETITIFVLLTLFTLGACGSKGGSKRADGDTSNSSQPTKQYAEQWSWRVVKEYPHSTNSYTQGLQFVDGVMWEGTGQHGESHLQRIDLATGKVDIVASLPAKEFGEGILLYKDRIYQLTWLSEVAHVYNREGEELNTLHFEGEGWGLTSDGETIYMSDGTSTLRCVNPDTFKPERSIFVTLDGHPLDLLNELEWIEGKIWANVYMTSSIVVINPTTGVVEAFLDLPELDNSKHNPKADVLNGIAYDKATGRIYVTGKNWDKLYEIEVIK